MPNHMLFGKLKPKDFPEVEQGKVESDKKLIERKTRIFKSFIFSL